VEKENFELNEVVGLVHYVVSSIIWWLFAKWMSVKPLEVCFFDESKLLLFFLLSGFTFLWFIWFFFVSVLVDLSF